MTFMEINLAIPIFIRHQPNVQAVYLFGSFGTVDERPESDVDLALLLPVGANSSLAASPLAEELAGWFGREVDVINLRTVNTVFQKEIVMAERRIYCVDQAVADEFELRVLSQYQKLNEERREIIEDGLAKGRFVA